MKEKLTQWVFENPLTKERIYFYVPILEVFLVANHKIGKPVRCYLDTGASVNIFPWEYGTACLGFSDKTMKKGLIMSITGVSGIKTEGYGHVCTIQHPDFCLKDVMIYFVKDQPYPLLGRVGFMDQFKKIVFDEEEKMLELVL